MIEDNYFTLDMIGRGGSSNVYKVWEWTFIPFMLSGSFISINISSIFIK